MKIFLVAVLPPNPAPEANHAFYLSLHLALNGHEVHVLTGKGSIKPDHPHVCIYPIMQEWDWTDMRSLASTMRRCSPDAILLYYLGSIYNSNPMITFVPTLVKKLLPGVPFVTLFSHVFGASTQSKNTFTKACHKAIRTLLGKGADYNFGTLLRDSHRLIVLSDHHRAILEDKLPGVGNKCVLVPPPLIMPFAPNENGMTRQRMRERLGLRPDEFLFVYFGFIYPSKGIETLLRAFQSVSLRETKVRLILVGGEQIHDSRPDYAKEMRCLSTQLGVEAKVKFTGAFTWKSDEGSCYLHAADACVLPFDDGVFLNNSSFAAAATHGLPIITTRGKIVEPAFIDGGNVLFCPPKDYERLAGQMNRLIQDDALRQRLGVGALRMAEEWFSWDKAIKRTVASMSR